MSVQQALQPADERIDRRLFEAMRLPDGGRRMTVAQEPVDQVVEDTKTEDRGASLRRRNSLNVLEPRIGGLGRMDRHSDPPALKVSNADYIEEKTGLSRRDL